MFAGNARAFIGLDYKERLISLQANIRVMGKLLTLTNTLAYCDCEFIMVVKFLQHWPQGLCYKKFYGCNFNQPKLLLGTMVVV
jgi:hypothetical protein